MNRNRIARFPGKLLWLIAALLFIALAAKAAAAPPLPWQEGEKLTFKLKWAFIPAGEATLEVLPVTTHQGQPARHFRLTAKTNEFMDNFFEVRDQIDAFCDLDMTHTIGYIKKQHEGSTHHDVVVNFDWDKQEATFYEDGKLERTTKILPGSFDPLSIFYRFRMENLAVGQTYEVPVTDGKKCVIGRGDVVKTQKKKVGAGKFECFLLEPELKHIGGVFKKSPRAEFQVWLSEDARKLVVRIRSAVVVGSFTAELEEAQNAGL